MPSNPEEKQSDTPERKTGVLLVQEGFVRQADVEIALEIQQGETNPSAFRPKVHPRTIGEILCDLNLITPIDLSAVLKKYGKHLNLEQILIIQGSIDEAALSAAMETVEGRTEPIGEILLQKGIITETQLYNAYSLQHNLPFKSYDQFTLIPEDRSILSTLIGKNFAHRFGVIPVSLNQKCLGVAISNPERLSVIEALRAKQTDLRIQCTFVTTGTFNRLFKRLYAKEPFQPRSEPVTPARPPEQKKMARPNRDDTFQPEESVIQNTCQDQRTGNSIPVELADTTGPAAEGGMISPTPVLQEQKTVYTEILSNPETQREAVMRLHSAYERLAITKGLRTSPSDPHLFNRFIQHHFQLISQRYHCRRVSFNIVDRQPRIIITAMPLQPLD